MLRSFCTVSKSEYDDFVGLKFVDGQPRITFPRGFSLVDDEEQTRKDIIRLLATIQKFGGRRDGLRNKTIEGETSLSFPILSYQYIIKDFLAHGYYIEHETQYKDGKKGKLNWKRTIQNKKPVYNNGNLVYLDFIVKVDKTNTNNLLTKIHEYCVRESFEKLGWLYLSSNTLPKKPDIKFNKRKFLTVLQDALNNTFNTNKRLLFESMINIINSKKESIDDEEITAFGVERFEYVWEKMIDYVFGENNKEQYFPHAKWHIINGDKVESSALEPDTIMMYENKLYILDAKYYKYGITGNPQHLPASSSVEKQITYGDYACENIGHAKNTVYNAFIMPFDKALRNDDNYKFVSVGTVDWETYTSETANHKYVLGVLVDTRFLIDSYSRHNNSEIEELSNLILESLAKYKELN